MLCLAQEHCTYTAQAKRGEAERSEVAAKRLR